MNMIAENLLRNYNIEEKELFLKARFAVITTSLVILATLATIIYAIYLKGDLIFVQALGAVVMLAALGALIKGYYSIAIHTIFITTFTALWIVLFFEPISAGLTKVDTIVLVVGLLAAMPVAFFKSRKPIVYYFLCNVIIFIFYNYYLTRVGNFTTREYYGYFLDNTVALVFVFLFSFNASGINQQTLSFLKKEIEERKKAEIDLLESKNLLVDHLNNTPVGAIFWDSNFCVTEWNPAAETIFGYTREEAIGKHASLILPEDVKQMVDTIFQELLAGSGGNRSVNENITKKGKRILCDWYNTGLKNTNGEKIGVASLVNDITEKKKAQEMMIQSEKIMSVGGLAAGMAHEIRNPLSGIMQNAQVVYNRLIPDLPANNKVAEELGTSMTSINRYAEKRNILNQLNTIHQSGQHIAKVIENMLNFSRKSDLTRTSVDIKELIENTINLAKNLHDTKKGYDFRKIEIIREYGPDLPVIFCEKSKIQQVILNLLKNASESMKPEKEEGDPPQIAISLRKDQKHVHIEVADNGTGMDSETLEQIFEPFFTTKAADVGTGLGLSISNHIIVNDHGGQLEVESKVGEGTKFIIKLPFRDSE